jgi:hypothetical protein
VARIAAFVVCCAALTGCGDAAHFTFDAPHGWRAMPAQSPVLLAAVAPDSRRQVTVVETRVPASLTFEQFAHNEPKMLRLAVHARNVEVRETTLQDRRALRVTYVRDGKDIMQYFVRTGDLMYVVTYTSER